jgi:hypothetical protein
MDRLILPVIGLLAACLPCIATPSQAQDCRLCSSPAVSAADGEQPLVVDIISGLTFTRAAHSGTGKGSISVATDGVSNVGGALVALGGYAVAGMAVIRGTPGRTVRIDLPGSVEMTSSTGSKIEIGNLRTSLQVTSQLDASGRLTFSFGGELSVGADIAGKFRGRIPITAQYE